MKSFMTRVFLLVGARELVYKIFPLGRNGDTDVPTYSSGVGSGRQAGRQAGVEVGVGVGAGVGRQVGVEVGVGVGVGSGVAACMTMDYDTSCERLSFSPPSIAGVWGILPSCLNPSHVVSCRFELFSIDACMAWHGMGWDGRDETDGRTNERKKRKKDLVSSHLLFSRLV